jgi:hypothetical protein
VTLLSFRSFCNEDGDPTGDSQQTIHAAANLRAGASEENVEEEDVEEVVEAAVVEEDMEVDNETPEGDSQEPSTFDRLDELRGTNDRSWGMSFHPSLLSFQNRFYSAVSVHSVVCTSSVLFSPIGMNPHKYLQIPRAIRMKERQLVVTGKVGQRAME